MLFALLLPGKDNGVHRRVSRYFLRTIGKYFFILCRKKYRGRRPVMDGRNQDCICRSVFKSITEEEIRTRYIQVLIKYITQQEESKRM